MAELNFECRILKFSDSITQELKRLNGLGQQAAGRRQAAAGRKQKAGGRAGSQDR